MNYILNFRNAFMVFFNICCKRNESHTSMWQLVISSGWKLKICVIGIDTSMFMLKVCRKVKFSLNQLWHRNSRKFPLEVMIFLLSYTLYFIPDWIHFSYCEISLLYVHSPDIIYFAFIRILLINNNLKKRFPIMVALSWAVCAFRRTIIIFISAFEQHDFFETLEYVW